MIIKTIECDMTKQNKYYQAIIKFKVTSVFSNEIRDSVSALQAMMKDGVDIVQMLPFLQESYAEIQEQIKIAEDKLKTMNTQLKYVSDLESKNADLKQELNDIRNHCNEALGDDYDDECGCCS